MIEQALYAILSGHAGLSSLVDNRIYPIVLPQGPLLPAVTYQRVSGEREETHDGPSGLARPRFQVSCWAQILPGVNAFDQARAVAEQVRLALDGYQGTAGGVQIEVIQLENEVDLFEPETQIFHSAIDFTVWHQEG